MMKGSFHSYVPNFKIYKVNTIRTLKIIKFIITREDINTSRLANNVGSKYIEVTSTTISQFDQIYVKYMHIYTC